MEFFSDIHIHALYGVDDGAKTPEDMYALIDAAYADGTRVMCLTPHYHPRYFDDNVEQCKRSFAKLSAYVEKNYPDMRIFPGNELRYGNSCERWIASGECISLNNGQYLLVDFDDEVDGVDLITAVERMLNCGYRPILAHVERYKKIHRDMREVEHLKAKGVVIQIDAMSVFGLFGKGAKKRCKRILEYGLADVVSSDAHNLTDRPPQMSRFYEFAVKNYGKKYADSLCRGTALRLLGISDM